MIPFAVILLASFAHARAAEWQWSAPVEALISTETQDHPRAFLWVPPNCKRIRGVVVGQHNMEEEMILENPAFRSALSAIDFAEIWVTPALDLFFRFDQGSGEAFDAMLKSLAAASGYAELETVPVVPMGHSAAASYPWNFAAWAPDRTLAVISVSGQWPYYKDKNTPDWAGRTVDGVPGLVTMGEYEAAYDRAGAGLADRAAHPMTALSMLAEPAGEHFSATEDKISFIAQYIRKAAQVRLPSDWPMGQRPALKKIDPTKDGWLVDRGRKDGKPVASAAPVGRYKGDPKDAFWTFDAEMAKATEDFGAKYVGQKIQLVGYMQKDGIVPQIPKRHVRVALKFEPESDGMTFKVRGALLDTAPQDWMGFKQGETAPHSDDASKISIYRICGPVQQISADTFAIRFYRMGTNNPKRSNTICLMLRHPGNGTYRPMMLESDMQIPGKNTVGEDQKLAFALPQSIRFGTPSLPLNGKSSAGLPVYYYIREGPATVEGNTLRFSAVPPRAKFPVKVTVVAWQWGSPVDPKVKTAEPIEASTFITRP